MHKIFDFLNRDILYQRCILASTAAAIMASEFDMLGSMQSWDGYNYNFQDMEGIKGVISFGTGQYICVIQNTTDYIEGEEKISMELFKGADSGIYQLAINEALPYLLVSAGCGDVPAASIAFWGDENNNYSNMEEKELIDKSDSILFPYLCSEEEAKDYWEDNYEMNTGQIKLMEEIYRLKINAVSKVIIDKNKKEKLEKWFGEIDSCIEAFLEMDIYFG